MESKIKCIVWDLDNTLWKGILSEDPEVFVDNEVYKVIYELDKRGILQSICSRNNYDQAMMKLKEFGLYEYFLYPQISWGPKSDGIKKIAMELNIGIDSFAFIDDQAFERDEVKFKHPQVRCIDVSDIDKILDMNIFNPVHLTNDSKNRRILYQNDKKRKMIQESFQGTEEEFLRTLEMKFYINVVKEGDLARAEELTVRTHQLNATGVTYSYQELEAFSKDDQYTVLISQLSDKYGDYGKIGLALIKKTESRWVLKLLLMSCRVMSRGVGSVMLNYIIKKAKEANVTLTAEFIPTNTNRMMYVAYKFAGFTKFDMKDNIEILKIDKYKEVNFPDYVQIVDEADNNLSYSIREISENDIARSTEIIRNAFETVALDFSLTRQNCPSNGAFMEEKKLLDDFLRGIPMYGLFEGSKQVGFAALEHKDNKLYYLEKLAVLPGYRHKGYGKKLIDHVKHQVRINSGGYISIGIIYENKILLNWYEKYGFVQTGIKKFDHLPFTVCFLEWQAEK